MHWFQNCIRKHSVSRSWTLKILSISVLAFSATVLAVGCGDEEGNPAGVDQVEESAIPQPLPVPRGPSPEEQADLIERVLAGEELTWDDAEIAAYFQSEYIDNLSSGSQFALQSFFNEVEALGLYTYEFEASWDNLAAPQTPEYQAMVDELIPLLEFDIEEPRKDGGATVVALFGLGAAAVGCVGKAEACMDDSIDNFTACAQQECAAGKEADIDCCYEEGKEDISNCSWTCGFNGPDPEYNSNCCKPKKKARASLLDH